MQEVEIRKVKTKKDKREFINLAYNMHKDHKQWVPPLYMHERHYIDPKKNPHMKYSETICLLAYKNGKPAGRIMGIINTKLNEIWNIKQARFCNFESIDDQVVCHSLFSEIEKWAKGYKMEKLVGPLGFSNQDPQGFLVEGFEERPSVGTIYNFEYIPRLVENEGFTKEVDYVTYRIPVLKKVPEIYEKISNRTLNRKQVKLIEFHSKGEIKRILPDVLRFMNKTYKDIYGFIPLTEDAIKKATKNYKEIIDPNLLKVVVDKNNNIISFILGIKDITPGFIKARGRLLPFGYFIIKSTQKKSKRLDLLLGAIAERYRGKGLDTLMAIAMIRTANKLGMTYVDSHHELETNTKVQAEMKRMGGCIYKRHRVYKKEL